MSEKAVVKFLKSLDENEALKKEFVAKKPKTTDPAGIVAFASKRGFDFTADELEKYAASFATTPPREALSDKDLNEVVGGTTFSTGAIYGSVSTQILRDTYYSAVVANRLA
jgi:predicted ribosomally synthesized peptide with nif11-like leader